jgi:hypothetical protein
MTYLRKYTREQLIAVARERGIQAPENATDEELKVVERRLNAERGWICEPQPEKDLRQQWIDRHRDVGHEPYAAPSRENPERWECDCPETSGIAVWRILTAEQLRQRYSHLRNRPLPSYIADTRKRSEEQRGRKR